MKEREDMGRVGERGSTLGFVLVGIVLAGLLVGGIYFVNRQSTEQISTPGQSQEQQPSQEEKQNPPPAEPGNKKPESKTPTTTPQAGTAHELPATGPEETIGTLLVLGLLGGLSTGYARSRRAHLSL